ncbi:MAG: putative Ig domain-containing protein, partial [Patescibacteria group bacterium]
SLTFVASDGSLSDSKTFSVVVVAANVAPVIQGSVSTQNLTVGTAMSLTLPAATDTNGDAITYSITGTLPAGLSFNPATRVFSGTPTATGTTSLTFVASDGSLSDSKTFSVVVVGMNPPTISGGNDFSMAN